MITFKKSKCGDITAKIDNIFLHSSYSPANEAEKFIYSNKLDNAKTLVIIAPALNYISSIIKEKKSNCKIISIYLFQEFYNLDEDKSNYKYLYNTNTEKLKDFFNRAINELDVEGLRVIEWTPLKKIKPDVINTISTSLNQHIREMHGNITTTSGFGKKLFSNFIRNYLFVKNYSIITQTDKPLIITGSGPSLQKDSEFIKNNRNSFVILSLPSSLTYLKYLNIKPDYIISTDPGFFAKYHLYNFDQIPLIIPFYASIPSSFYSSTICPISSNYFIEDKLLDKNFPFFKIPSNGSVAGSALFASLYLSSSYIFFSGLDFSFLDCLSHIRPHCFDNLLDSKSHRNTPINSIYFERNIINSKKIYKMRRQSNSLCTYQGWFSEVSTKFYNKCFFIDHHSSPPGSFKSLDYKEIKSILGSSQKKYNIKSYRISYNSRIKAYLNLLNYLIYLSMDLKNKISLSYSNEEILNLINTQFLFNIFLPELLEFKCHYYDLSNEFLKKKAINIIDKQLSFLEEFKKYV